MSAELLELLNVLGMFVVAIAYVWVNHIANRGLEQ